MMTAAFDVLTLPYQVVRNVLRLTALEVGCGEDEASTLSQSAWHLTNRGMDGVGYTLAYLHYLHADPSLERDVYFPLALDAARVLLSGEQRSVTVTGGMAPLFLLPCAAFMIDQDAGPSGGLLLSFHDQSVAYSKSEGLRLEHGDMFDLHRISPFDVPSCTLSRITFDEGIEWGTTYEFKKHEALSLPSKMYHGEDSALLMG